MVLWGNFSVNGWTPPGHLLLDSVPNLGPLISRWEINKFENCWYKSVRILQVLKLFFQQFLNLSSSQRDSSGPRFGALSKNRWSEGITCWIPPSKHTVFTSWRLVVGWESLTIPNPKPNWTQQLNWQLPYKDLWRLADRRYSITTPVQFSFKVRFYWFPLTLHVHRARG